MTVEQCFMGLADRTRLRMLNLLMRGKLCGCDVQYVLGVSQSNVSRQFRPYVRAAASQFSPTRRTLTQQLLEKVRAMRSARKK